MEESENESEDESEGTSRLYVEKEVARIDASVPSCEEVAIDDVADSVNSADDVATLAVFKAAMPNKLESAASIAEDIAIVLALELDSPSWSESVANTVNPAACLGVY